MQLSSFGGENNNGTAPVNFAFDLISQHEITILQ